MKVSNWEKRTAIAQVSLALKTYSLMVEKNSNMNVQGDLIASWDRSGKKYLISVVPRIKYTDVKSDTFKNTLAFCRANNYRLIVVAWECENRLVDYMLDAEAGDSQEFKVIEYSRMDSLKKEYVNIKTQKDAA